MSIDQNSHQVCSAQSTCPAHSEQRLRLVLKACEISSTAFAEWLRVSPQCLNNWFLRGLPHVRVEQLAQTLSLRKAWLETGEGVMYPIIATAPPPADSAPHLGASPGPD